MPASGSWKTRPISFARRCSGQPLISRPARRMVPASMRKVPATALSVVLLPDPLVPITTTKLPGSIVRSKPRKARTSSGVPALNVLQTPHISSNAMVKRSARAELWDGSRTPSAARGPRTRRRP